MSGATGATPFRRIQPDAQSVTLLLRQCAAEKCIKRHVQRGALQDRQVRVTGKSRDDLQEVIAFCRSSEFEVGLQFGNFRD